MTVLGLMLINLIPFIAVGIWAHRRQKRMHAIAWPQNPAFKLAISMKKLRSDPEVLEAIRDKVAAVVAASVPMFTEGRAGGRFLPNFTSFLIDINREAHDPAMRDPCPRSIASYPPGLASWHRNCGSESRR